MTRRGHVDEIAREIARPFIGCVCLNSDAHHSPLCSGADLVKAIAAALEIALATALQRAELAERERDGLHALVVQARQERDEAEELRETSLRVAIDQKKRIAALTAELHGALYEIDVMLNDEHRPTDGLKAWARRVQNILEPPEPPR